MSYTSERAHVTVEQLDVRFAAGGLTLGVRGLIADAYKVRCGIWCGTSCMQWYWPDTGMSCTNERARVTTGQLDMHYACVSLTLGVH